jgi:hypothetical protein
VKAREYLGMIWPPVLMPVQKESIDDMMLIEQNREWLGRHAKTYDRRAWWTLGIAGCLMGLNPYCIVLFIPALHIRVQVWRMLGALKKDQSSSE